MLAMAKSKQPVAFDYLRRKAPLGGLTEFLLRFGPPAALTSPPSSRTCRGDGQAF
jgi:hypothetical protein